MNPAWNLNRRGEDALHDLPALKRAAADSEPLIAEHARWAIERINSRIQDPPAAHLTRGMQPVVA